MTMPDYSRLAVTVAVEKGYGDLLWRNECPIGCGWHASEWTLRTDAVAHLNEERGQHVCLRVANLPALKCLVDAADQLRLARDANEARARDIEKMRGHSPVEGEVRQVNDRRMELAAGFARIAALGQGLMLREENTSE